MVQMYKIHLNYANLLVFWNRCKKCLFCKLVDCNFNGVVISIYKIIKIFMFVLKIIAII